jgi:hypothetical protein
MNSIRIPALVAVAAFALAGCASVQQGAAVKGAAVPPEKARPAEVKAVAAKTVEAPPVESQPLPADAKPPVASGQANIVKPLFKGEITHAGDDKVEQPKDIGWTKSGDLFVCDRTGILIFDKKDKFVSRIDFKEGWGIPSGCTVDQDGGYLVSFFGDQVVRKIDGKGKLAWEVKYPLAEGKPANNPNHAFVDPDGSYWITDGIRFQLLKGKVSKNDFNIAMTIGRLSGSYDAKTRVATDLPGVIKAARNPYTGNIYALLGPTIKVLDPKSGAVVKEFGGFGMENDRFQQVGDIFFKKDGSHLVLDPMMNTVKEFSKDFAYVATWADQVKPGQAKLSANFSSGFTYNEATRRLYVISGMGDRIYVFETQK